MLNLPFPCKMYRVRCTFCGRLLGHIILDKETSEEAALNRAQSTFTTEIHSSLCESQRKIRELITTKNNYDFIVELI